MPRVRDVLYRFSPAGAPGAASSAGVPVDRLADRSAELAPVFALLTGTEQECREILEAGEREAAAVRAEAEQRARAVVAAARAQVELERAAVVSRALQQEAAERALSLDAATGAADELRERAARQLPSFVADAVTRVLAMLEEPQPPTTEPTLEPTAGPP